MAASIAALLDGLLIDSRYSRPLYTDFYTIHTFLLNQSGLHDRVLSHKWVLQSGPRDLPRRSSPHFEYQCCTVDCAGRLVFRYAGGNAYAVEDNEAVRQGPWRVRLEPHTGDGVGLPLYTRALPPPEVRRTVDQVRARLQRRRPQVKLEVESSPSPELESTPGPEFESSPSPELESTPGPALDFTPAPQLEAKPPSAPHTGPREPAASSSLSASLAPALSPLFSSPLSTAQSSPLSSLQSSPRSSPHLSPKSPPKSACLFLPQRAVGSSGMPALVPPPRDNQADGVPIEATKDMQRDGLEIAQDRVEEQLSSVRKGPVRAAKRKEPPPVDDSRPRPKIHPPNPSHTSLPIFPSASRAEPAPLAQGSSISLVTTRRPQSVELESPPPVSAAHARIAHAEAALANAIAAFQASMTAAAADARAEHDEALARARLVEGRRATELLLQREQEALVDERQARKRAEAERDAARLELGEARALIDSQRAVNERLVQVLLNTFPDQ